MKKVGIMSMQRIANYGSFLQAYALKRLIEELGYRVEFVDYHVGAPVIAENADSKNKFVRKLEKGLETFQYQAPLSHKLSFIRYKQSFAKGTRISSVASDIPKPMIKIEGIPVLEREIGCLKEQGFDDIIITVSHLGNIIMDYFGDGSGNSPVTRQPFGVHIEYYFENEPLGNAGALFKIKDKLTEDFLLLKRAMLKQAG